MPDRSDRRDLRIDFCRGLALAWMFVDHMPLSWLSLVSLRRFTSCDAAEIFVFLAGLSSSLAYARAPSALRVTVPRILRRAAQLYAVHLVLVALAGVEILIVLHLHGGDLDQTMHFDQVLAHPAGSLVALATLAAQPIFMEILPLYVILLLVFAATLPVLVRRPLWLLAASAGIYLAAPWLPHDPDQPFNLWAWQIVFFAGAVTIRAPWLNPRLSRLSAGAAVLILLAGLATHAHGMLHHAAAALGWSGYDGMGSWLEMGVAEKRDLHPLRLACILALAWLVSQRVPRSVGFLRGVWTAPVLLLGQNSLPVFCCSVLAAVAGQELLAADPGPLAQILAQGGGFCAMLVTALIATRIRRAGLRPPLAAAANPRGGRMPLDGEGLAGLVES